MEAILLSINYSIKIVEKTNRFYYFIFVAECSKQQFYKKILNFKAENK